MKQIITVERLKKFLDNYKDETPVTFIVDNIRADVWEMYGHDKPIISLRALIQAQDHIELAGVDWEPDGAA